MPERSNDVLASLNVCRVEIEMYLLFALAHLYKSAVKVFVDFSFRGGMYIYAPLRNFGWAIKIALSFCLSVRPSVTNLVSAITQKQMKGI